MGKSPDAFRTITEVSDWLETPTHVLRFWETKFPALKPVKRAGGRRYYRPGDMALLAGIKALLYEQGMSIKGVQKILRERGPRHVAGQSPLPWDAEALDDVAWEAPDSLGADSLGADSLGADSLGADALGSEALAGPVAELASAMGEPGAELAQGLEPDDLALPPPPVEPEGEAALTFLDAVLVGTVRRLREGAPMAEGEDDPPPEVVPFPDGARGPRGAPEAPAPETPAPGTPAPGTPAPADGAPVLVNGVHDAAPGPGGDPGADPARRLLLLLGRADRRALRARADRLAPLVARLAAACAPAGQVVGGADRGAAPAPLRARGDSL